MTITENSLTILTERERQIARLVSQGLLNKGIGRLLNITDGTIKVHLHNIFTLSEECTYRKANGKLRPLGISPCVIESV